MNTPSRDLDHAASQTPLPRQVNKIVAVHAVAHVAVPALRTIAVTTARVQAADSAAFYGCVDWYLYPDAPADSRPSTGAAA
jgi:hypothetical protein